MSFFLTRFPPLSYYISAKIRLRGKEVKKMAVFTNQATLSYNGIVTSSNIVTGELVQVLSVTKTAVNDTYGAGDTLSYAVSIVNSGNVAFTDTVAVPRT